ncbi:hypothetical protein E3983_04090 [Legionella israelensis]|uniref:Methyltransferase type 11 domain-containing protein n=1 Tax=Legionella israelensis TaxID=454 RepID=A0AAX1EFH2_9GAMM|nr:hypothetical protein [Legionella israelensis]QBR83607.1 hypothetical protein E3983_04090 [Legionella israelensis]
MQEKIETIRPHALQNLKINEMEIVAKIREIVGTPADPKVRVSRKDLNLDNDYFIHLDIGGEGYNEHMGYFSGFTTSINVNATEYQSNDYGMRIPNLVRLKSWFTNPSYPFSDGFADYITMQNAPLTSKNIDEIARCLRPGGVVELWISEDWKKEIERLARKLHSEPEFGIEDEFKGSTGSIKVRIRSQISLDLEMSAEDVISSSKANNEPNSHQQQLKLQYSALTVTFFNSIYRNLHQKKITYPTSETETPGLSERTL